MDRGRRAGFVDRAETANYRGSVVAWGGARALISDHNPDLHEGEGSEGNRPQGRIIRNASRRRVQVFAVNGPSTSPSALM